MAAVYAPYRTPPRTAHGSAPSAEINSGAGVGNSGAGVGGAGVGRTIPARDYPRSGLPLPSDYPGRDCTIAGIATGLSPVGIAGIAGIARLPIAGRDCHAGALFMKLSPC